MLKDNLCFASDVRIELGYEPPVDVFAMQPFIADVAASLADGLSIESSFSKGFEKFVEFEKYFEFLGRSDFNNLRLRNEFLFSRWNVNYLTFRTSSRCFRTDLKGKSGADLQDIGSLLRYASGSSPESAFHSCSVPSSLLKVLESLIYRGVVIPDDGSRSLRKQVPGVHRLQHASLLFSSGKTNILVDPHLHSFYNPGTTDFTRSRLNDSIDAIVISHAHLDHFWLSTILMFDKDTAIILPRVPRATVICDDMAARLRELGYKRVSTPEWNGPPVTIGDMEIHALPFFGEQPLLNASSCNPDIRNWGNTYIFQCSAYKAWILIDSGEDALGSMVQLAEDVYSRFGPIEFVFSNLRRFHIASPFYINCGLNWLTLTGAQMSEFSKMRSHCLTLGPGKVAEICNTVRAKHYLPYAHWWGDLGEHANPLVDTPGEDEGPLLAMLENDLLSLKAATKITPWCIGDGFLFFGSSPSIYPYGTTDYSL